MLLYSKAPSPSRSHSYNTISPSGSLAVAESVTSKGAVPLEGVAEAVTLGGARAEMEAWLTEVIPAASCTVRMTV